MNFHTVSFALTLPDRNMFASSVAQSCLILCDPMDCSLTGSSAHGILQARILEWVAMPSSMGSAWPRDWTGISGISCISRWIFFLPTVPPASHLHEILLSSPCLSDCFAALLWSLTHTRIIYVSGFRFEPLLSFLIFFLILVKVT